MKQALRVMMLLVAAVAVAQSPQRSTYGPLSQGNTVAIPNGAGSQAVSFEYVYSVTPGAASITIQGCMRGSGAPGNVGTCDAAVDTYTGTSNSVRSPSFTKVYDTFLITVGTLTGATLTVNTTVVVSKAGTSSGGSGSGTVSANNGSAGAVANYAAAGGSTTVGPDILLTDSGTTLTYTGTGGVSAKLLTLPGATSGTSTITPPAVAGTSTNPVIFTNAIQVPAGGATIGPNGGNWQISSTQIAGGLGNTLQSSTAPTIAAAGCGGAAASITANNGTPAFKINVGTTPGSACTITMPAAANGWNCHAEDITTQSTSVFVQKQTGAESTTLVTFTNFSDVAVATAYVASDILKVTCAAD